MEKVKIYYFIIFLSFLIPVKEDSYNIPTGEDYIVGEDGIKRMYVNIWGHVKDPGTYLVYEGVDITTLLSMAGGPLDGADLSKIQIIAKEDRSSKIININDRVRDIVVLDEKQVLVTLETSSTIGVLKIVE